MTSICCTLFHGVGGIIPHHLCAPVEDHNDTGAPGLSYDMSLDSMLDAIQSEADKEVEQIKSSCSHMTPREFYEQSVSELKKITQKDYSDTYTDHITDIDKEYQQEQHLLSINGTECFSIGDIQLISGVQKCGKTFALTMLCGALLKGEYNGVKSLISNPKILFFDTEQKEQKTATVAKRVRRIMYGGEPNEEQKKEFNTRFKIANLREFGTVDERLQYIITTLFKLSESGFTPDLVVLDGVADIIHNFNDNEECDITIRKLMQISTIFNCCVTSVLHYNKDGKTEKGHLGALYLNKVSDALTLTKHDRNDSNNKDGITYFELKHSHARDTDNCNPVYFAIGADGVPTRYNQAPTRYNRTNVLDYAVEVIKASGGAVNTTQLYEGIALKIKEYHGYDTTESAVRRQFEIDIKAYDAIIHETQGKSIIYKLKQYNKEISFDSTPPTESAPERESNDNDYPF